MGTDVTALLGQVYEELRGLAAAHFRAEYPGHTLQPTVLVHEVFLRLSASARLDVNDRQHFLRLASRVMRQVLLDHARAKAAEKRGPDLQRVTLSGLDSDIPSDALDSLDLEEALQRLAALNPRRAELVELRFFGGLTMEEVAESLDVSPETAKREWRLAKAWLARELATIQGDP